MQTHVITSVATLINIIPSLENQQNKGSLFYRGEGKRFQTPCLPALYRKAAWVNRERYFYNEILHRFPEALQGLETDLNRMVLMQHYRFPTRLLDVSESPLVALYFAVENKADDNEDAVVFCIKVPYKAIHYGDNNEVKKIAELLRKDSQFKLESPCDYRKVLFVKPQWRNDRIRAQQGQMLLFGCDGQKCNPVYLPQTTQSDAPHLYCEWRIPADCKQSIRKELYDLGIHEWTLFPDIEHLAKELKEKRCRRALDQ